jgi:5-methylcytosine-specific restriction endonuclease McrA
MTLKLIEPRIKARAASRVRMLSTEGGANAAHYQSDGHKAWAAAVKRRDGYRCVTPRCDSKGRLIADHIVEITDGGARFDVANGQTLCLACHNRKTARQKASRSGGAV